MALKDRLIIDWKIDFLTEGLTYYMIFSLIAQYPWWMPNIFIASLACFLMTSLTTLCLCGFTTAFWKMLYGPTNIMQKNYSYHLSWKVASRRLIDRRARKQLSVVISRLLDICPQAYHDDSSIHESIVGRCIFQTAKNWLLIECIGICKYIIVCWSNPFARNFFYSTTCVWEAEE